MLSFSETRAHQVVQQKSEQFMIYNQKQLTRIYPSAYRIDSSNFNPLPYWNAGCQLGACPESPLWVLPAAPPCLTLSNFELAQWHSTTSPKGE